MLIYLYLIIYTLHFSQWPSLTPAHQQQAKTNMKSEIKPFETLPRLLLPTRDAGLWRPYLTNSCLVCGFMPPLMILVDQKLLG